MQQKYRIDYINSSFLIFTPIVAAVLTYLHWKLEVFHMELIVWGVVFYILAGISITVGYHRLFSHRAYEASNIFKFFMLVFGAAAFENSCLKWCSDHRKHHLYCDTEKDPYNISKGFFWAHMGWILCIPVEGRKVEFVEDLNRDPLVAWQHKYYLPISIIAGLLLPTLIGLYYGSPIGGLAIIGFVRLVLVHHCTFFINSACHTFGKKNYEGGHTAKDSLIMALLTFGEGYHDFHHTFQADYRNGIKWYHLDPSKWVIWFSSKVGLTRNLKRVSRDQILKAQRA